MLTTYLLKNMLQSSRFAKFGVVGVVNTLVDISIFTMLRLMFNSNILFANTVSTSMALIVSLILNNNYTFKDRTLTLKRAVLYIIVTLIGLWVLQPLIIHAAANTAERIISNTFLLVFIPKIVAIAVTVIWNYLWYTNIIFPNRSKNIEQITRQ